MSGWVGVGGNCRSDWWGRVGAGQGRAWGRTLGFSGACSHVEMLSRQWAHWLYSGPAGQLHLHWTLRAGGSPGTGGRTGLDIPCPDVPTHFLCQIRFHLL